MSLRPLRHDKRCGWFSKSRGLSASVSFLSSPPPPRLLAPFFVWPLLRNSKETLASQATKDRTTWMPILECHTKVTKLWLCPLQFFMGRFLNRIFLQIAAGHYLIHQIKIKTMKQFLLTKFEGHVL